MTRRFVRTWSLLAAFGSGVAAFAQADDPSVARRWNDLLLESIRNDYARPVVHARNLFHISAAMWDAWAIFEEGPRPWLHEDEVISASDVGAARSETISHAAYQLLRQRFQGSPGWKEMEPAYRSLMLELGFDPDDEATRGDAPAAIGNRIAIEYIFFGLTDGANQVGDYANQWYLPVNDPLVPPEPGTQGILEPNRWQPLALEYFVDQSGNIVIGGYPEFLGPEWGHVSPFSLTPTQRVDYERDGDAYPVFLDPGLPPRAGSDEETRFLEGFEQVLYWSAHLDPTDGVMIDVSPNSIGNATIPTDPADFAGFYDRFEGGDAGIGHEENPVTGEPYPVQMVPRGDYARVLAEFWADGPDSETPPGHWFVLLNEVSDAIGSEKRIGGTGPVVDALEWDIKGYFALGGGMHDSAISAWSVKGWYDFVRPISAIRWMAENGQRTDPDLPGYHAQGLQLVPGLVEMLTEESTVRGERHAHLRGEDGVNIGKIAARCWKGPEYIFDPASSTAGCGWILVENWWPYQRPTFVSPNFAGYVSGHSTFSRAAAEIITELTGSPWFPGGLGEFEAIRNEFLVFENGPAMNIRLQWASYFDASDQCSLSRIWGGIHPPCDDIPGRLMGSIIGPQAWFLATDHFGETVSSCREDLDGNGTVGGGDVGIMLADWGCLGDCKADLNEDGLVNGADLGLLIAAWNSDC
ncbi:MAG: hypothetical protein OSA40_08475 [Phycisphaerales bacterium]|nr:hypothetical protein [Phycisphaerales bacterium]